MAPIYFQELKIKNYLDDLDIKNYLPMRADVVMVRGKKEVKQVPAVNNLLFVYTSEARLKEVCAAQPYLHYKYSKDGGATGRKMVVPQKQMEDFIRVSSIEDREVIYFDPETVGLDLEKGTPIRLHSSNSVLDGIEGIYIKIKGKREKRLVISLNGLHAVAMMVDINLIEKI